MGKDVVQNCFGDIETDCDFSIDEQELLVQGELTEELLGRKVSTVYLVGSHIAGCHQELRFLLQKDDDDDVSLFARISRVNGRDTFQVGNGRPIGDNDGDYDIMEDLPTLLEIDIMDRTMTVRDVKSALEQARNCMKRYDQGDCHALSQMVCDLLVPGTFPAELDW